MKHSISHSGSYTDQFVYLVSNDSSFDTVFGVGVGPTIELGSASGIGNDGFRIVEDGTSNVVDVVGEGLRCNLWACQDGLTSRKNVGGPDSSLDNRELGASIESNRQCSGRWSRDDSPGAGQCSRSFRHDSLLAVPEPSTALLGGLALLGLLRRRRLSLTWRLSLPPLSHDDGGFFLPILKLA